MQRLLGILLILALAGCGQLETGTSARPDQPMTGLSGDGLVDYVRQGPTGSQVGLSQQAFGGERYVVFHTAEALISTDTNGVEDVYLMDLLLGNLERISLGVGGAQPNGASSWATVSIDGRYVAFESRAENLVATDGNGHQDVFLRDRTKGQTILVSKGGDGDSFDAQISGLGLKLMFTSAATNLVPGDTNGHLDCFLYDLASTSLVRASLDRNGNQIEGSDSTDPAISYTGNQFVFASAGTNLPLYNGFRQIYGVKVKNLKPFLLSYGPGNQPGNGHSSAPSIAAQAKKVVFTSEAADLVADDSNGVADLFVFDLDAAGVSRASLDSSGNQLNGPSTVGALSGDGTKLAFITEASGAASGDGDTQPDAILKDLTTGQTTLVSRDSSGTKANGASGGVSVSLSGARAVFGTLATNLQPFDTTNDGDIYVHQPDVGNTILASQAFQPATGFAGRRSITIEYSQVPQAGDLNDDGHLDLVWVDDDHDVYVSMGSETGFEQPVAQGFSATHFCVGDFDADEVLDLAYSVSSSRSIRLAKGNGSGQLQGGASTLASVTPPVPIPPTFPPVFPPINPVSIEGVYATRLAGQDGILVTYSVTSPAYQGYQFFAPDGSGNYVQSSGHELSGSLASIRFGNIDGSEWTKVVTFSVPDQANPNYRAHVLNAWYGTTTTTTLDHGGVTGVTLADWNRDGFDDLITTCFTSYSYDPIPGVKLYLGDGSGAFALADTTLTGDAQEPLVADLTGDGKVDLVVDDGSGLLLIEGNGADLSGPQRRVFPFSPRGVSQLVDENGDAHPDLLTLTYDEAAIWLGLPSGAFWPEVTATRTVSINTNTGVVGDFGLDLWLDAVTGLKSAAFFLAGDGAGSLGPAWGFDFGVGVTGSFELAVEDLNRDGLLDLVAQSSTSTGFLQGVGDGTFVAAATASGGQGLRVADLDRDGRLDLIIATPAAIEVWRGQASGFTLWQTRPVAGDAKCPELMDLNEDGWLDLVVTTGLGGEYSSSNPTSDALMVALGQNGGLLDDFVALPCQGHPTRLCRADVNNDGHQDLVAVCPSLSNYVGFVDTWNPLQEDFHPPFASPFILPGSGLMCWLGDGQGGLTQVFQQNLPVPLRSFNFQVRDFDGDGFADVAIAGQTRSLVAIFRGDGTGQFTHQANWQFPAPFTAVSDLNGDGRWDLVGGSSVLLGK
ncbi:MAG: FG-GAP-like repeat-containing protein [Vulcanimicrobiota bacterium]